MTTCLVTGGRDKVEPFLDNDPALWDTLLQSNLAEPDEVAAAVEFFATGPDHITGQVLSVSGGLTMAG